MEYTKLTNNALITQLIEDKDVLAIYLGGSRLLNLELSESDYDIIVVSKNKAILEHYGAYLGQINGCNAHVIPVYFYDVVKKLNMPEENLKASQALCLLQFLWTDTDYIYQSDEYKCIKNILNNYYNKLGYFCLEKLLEILIKPNSDNLYIKADYHYVCFEFLLSNFEKDNRLFLTNEQKEQLKTTKKLRKVNREILALLPDRLFKQYQLWYRNYQEIYQEVLACQKQFI